MSVFTIQIKLNEYGFMGVPVFRVVCSSGCTHMNEFELVVADKRLL